MPKTQTFGGKTMTFFITIFYDNFWWPFLMTIFYYNFWWQFLMIFLMTILVIIVIIGICDIWDTYYNIDNWEPGFMTIIGTWHFFVTLDSIRNSCNVLKCICPKCNYPKCISAKCTRLACLLSFASLFWKDWNPPRKPDNCSFRKLPKEEKYVFHLQRMVQKLQCLDGVINPNFENEKNISLHIHSVLHT